MPLINCPECNMSISTQALACPHCGYPVNPRKKNISSKHRLPNGFGRITKIKGRYLRKPWRAMVTQGKDKFGKPIGKIVGFYESYNDAYQALLEYNNDPNNLNNKILVKELYEEWSNEYAINNSDASVRLMCNAWAYCSAIADLRASEIRPRHIRSCMTDGYRIEDRGKNKGQKVFATDNLKAKIKTLFNLMLDYAVAEGYIEKNYARIMLMNTEITKSVAHPQKEHIPFSQDELNTLWSNVGKIKYVDWIIIQCYMGWRPEELASLKLNEVYLDEWYIQSGIKTEAGKQRIVPIHTKIRDLVIQNYNFAQSINSDFLFNDQGKSHNGNWGMTYRKYAYRFPKVISALKLDPSHRPHDPRITFVTNAKRVHMDEYALKLMIGHKIDDITEGTYTKRDIEWLREDLEKLE